MVDLSPINNLSNYHLKYCANHTAKQKTLAPDFCNTFLNFTFINLIDDYGKLFILKMYKLYEKKKYSMVKIIKKNSQKVDCIIFNDIPKDKLYIYLFCIYTRTCF